MEWKMFNYSKSLGTITMFPHPRCDIALPIIGVISRESRCPTVKKRQKDVRKLRITEPLLHITTMIDLPTLSQLICPRHLWGRDALLHSIKSLGSQNLRKISKLIMSGRVGIWTQYNHHFYQPVLSYNEKQNWIF